MIWNISNNFLTKLILLCFTGTLAGCVEDYLVFTTATKFGVDISQQAEQPPKLVLGYKRAETAIIPTPKGNATQEEDTYSVLGNFCVKVDPILFQADEDSLQIRSVFATGLAAQTAANNKDLQIYFARAVTGYGSTEPGKSDKNCFGKKPLKEID